MPKRKSGVLLHLAHVSRQNETTPFEYTFLDLLSNNGQQIWQHLPINPPGKENSPYSSLSAFAGDPKILSENLIVKYRESDYKKWIEENSDWCFDWAIFNYFKQLFGNKEWYKWPKEYKFYNENNINVMIKKEERFITEILLKQFVFDRKWAVLKKKCNDKNISLFGDIPFYVALDSSDVWSKPHLFDLDENLAPKSIAGVPPDYFSAKGQIWENPLYDWKQHSKDNYLWWQRRIDINKRRFDILRIDHFRAMVSSWSIKPKSKTAADGYWRRGPGNKLLDKIIEILPKKYLVAEDLGLITKSVKKLIKDYKIKGMNVLQFGYDSKFPNEHHHTKVKRNSVCYLGTHDNNTIKGWFEEMQKGNKKECYDSLVRDYHLDGTNICKEMIKIAMNTKADLCIITIQDLLELGEEGRINIPGNKKRNWNLIIKQEDIRNIDWIYLKKLTEQN